MGGKAKHSQCCMKATPDRRIPEPGSIRPALHKVSPPGLFRGSRSDAGRFSDLALDCRNKSGNDDRKEGSFDGARPGLAPLFLVPDRNHSQASPSDLFRGAMRDARRFSDLVLDCRRYDGPKDKVCSNAFQQYVFFLAK